MRYIGGWCRIVLALGATALACPAQAEPQADQATVEALIKKIDALQRRLDEVEGRQRAAKPPANEPSANATYRTAPPPAAAGTPAAAPVQSAAYPIQQPVAPARALLPPERMGNQYEGEGGDALRSDLPGLSLRIPVLNRRFDFTALRTSMDTVTWAPAIRPTRRPCKRSRSPGVLPICKGAISDCPRDSAASASIRAPRLPGALSRPAWKVTSAAAHRLPQPTRCSGFARLGPNSARQNFACWSDGRTACGMKASTKR